MSMNTEDFFLIDIIGGSQTISLHPTRPIVAYNSGKIIDVII